MEGAAGYWLCYSKFSVEGWEGIGLRALRLEGFRL